LLNSSAWQLETRLWILLSRFGRTAAATEGNEN
jgi:hypothetical protein